MVKKIEECEYSNKYIIDCFYEWIWRLPEEKRQIIKQDLTTGDVEVLSKVGS